jgi:hypothetical protein
MTKPKDEDLFKPYKKYSGIYGLPCKNLTMLDIEDVKEILAKQREEFERRNIVGFEFNPETHTKSYVYKQQHVDKLKAQHKREVEALKEKYNELLMAVSNKYPSETRHQTALRYIKNAEEVKANECENQQPNQ